ncbi:hypothetical protein D3C84_693800 [compost metagenome]
MALIPPNMAYIAPSPPTPHTMIQRAVVLSIWKTSDTRKRLSRAIAPVYNTIGRREITYMPRNKIDVMVRVCLSKRRSRNSGMVEIPSFKYFGRKNIANSTIVMAAITSQAITIKPVRNDSPFRPTRCSVERFISSIEPPIYIPVMDRPPRKYPSADSVKCALCVL